MRKSIKAIKINRDYEAMIPPLSDEDFKNLKKSVKEEGLIYPLILNRDGVLLDGHHRLKACEEAGITFPEIIEKRFTSVFDEQEFVISSNLNRRHLNTAQKAELGIKLHEIEKEKAQERQEATLPQEGEKGFQKSNVVPLVAPHKKDQDENQEEDRKAEFDKVMAPHISDEPEGEGKAIEIAAKKAGVGKETLRRAEKIKEVAREDPEVARDWEDAKAGKTTVSRIYKDKIQPVSEEKLEGVADEMVKVLNNISEEKREWENLPSHKEFVRREKLLDAARAILDVVDGICCPICGEDYTHLRWDCGHEMDVKEAARVTKERYHNQTYKGVKKELLEKYGQDYDKVPGGESK